MLGGACERFNGQPYPFVEVVSRNWCFSNCNQGFVPPTALRIGIQTFSFLFPAYNYIPFQISSRGFGVLGFWGFGGC